MKYTIGKILTRGAVLCLAAGTGVLASVILVTPFILYANATANDGPLFPPPLVALGFFGLPFGVLLLPMQLIELGYEVIQKRTPGLKSLFPAAVTGGGLAGGLWFLGLRSSQAGVPLALAMIGTAILQSLVVFGCTWLASRFVVNPLEKRINQQPSAPTAEA